MGDQVREIRVALRRLARSGSFGVLSALTLALGIGVTTAVFTLVDAVMLRPLPFPGADRLISVAHEAEGGETRLPMSSGLYELYREHGRTLDGIAMWGDFEANVMLRDGPVRLRGRTATPTLFDVLRVAPSLGRGFTPEEGEPGAVPVAIVSHGTWRDRFGADPGILGSTLVVNGNSVEIVGVLPRGFAFPDDRAELWLPLSLDRANAPLASFNAPAVARVAEGFDAEDGADDVRRMVADLEQLAPDRLPEVQFLRSVQFEPVVAPMKSVIVGDTSNVLWVLLGSVGLVLLVACTNVANLLLVRADSRQQELDIRLSLGADDRSLLQWFVSEAVLLGLAGCAMGVGLAYAALETVLRVVPAGLPRVHEIALDGRVLLFALGVSALTAALFSVVPFLRARKAALRGHLGARGTRGHTGGRERHTLRNGLAVSQVALALTLMIASGLMFRSLHALRGIDPGFDRDGAATVQLSVTPDGFPTASEVEGFYRQLEDRLMGLPGSVSVGFVSHMPLQARLPYFNVASEDHPRAEGELPIFGHHRWVGGDLESALGLEVLEGRGLTWEDGATGARSVVVGRRFAEMWWPDRSPLGSRLRIGPESDGWYTVVGVVEDLAGASLTDPPREAVYWPLTSGAADAPQTRRAVSVVLRTRADPAGVIGAIRAAVSELSPTTPVSNPATLRSIFDEATAQTSFAMSVIGAAALLSLALGLVGVYGVVSYVVGQRRRELGVRLALGATARRVRALVLRQGLILALVGTGVGVALSLLGSRALGSVLYDVETVDPVLVLGTAAVLTGAVLSACMVPAWRASRVAPASVLQPDA